MLKSITTAALLSVFALNASAALVDNGGYTTDTNSGLEWLDLSSTTGLSMEAALAANSGWRYAANSEVENIFLQLFDGYYDTHPNGFSNSADGAYADQLADVNNFRSLFGVTQSGFNYPTSFRFTLGLYEDEAGIIRAMGTAFYTNPNQTAIEGLDFNSVYDTTTAFNGRGTFLVRTSAVPIPAAVWLFGSALAGLGWMRRRPTI